MRSREEIQAEIIKLYEELVGLATERIGEGLDSTVLEERSKLDELYKENIDRFLKVNSKITELKESLI